MGSGKYFVSVLIAVKFLMEIYCSVAFPVEAFAYVNGMRYSVAATEDRITADNAEKNDTKPEVKFFECHAMACLIGYQFCHPFWKRCDDCLLYEKDCFTSRQQLNCTVFCQETWLTKEREILKNEKCKTGEGQNATLPWIAATVVLAVLLLACGCVLLLIKIRFSVRWISLELPNRSENNNAAAENQINVDKTEASMFLVKDESLKQEQVICTNRNSKKGQNTIMQSSDADRCLDLKSIYSDGSNIMNTPPPRPETDSDD